MLELDKDKEIFTFREEERPEETQFAYNSKQLDWISLYRILIISILNVGHRRHGGQ